MPKINFKAELTKIGSWTILRLPKEESKKLPSRGMVMAEGTINSYRFRSELEPDGKGSHWLALNKTMLKGVGAKVGDTVMVVLKPSKEWPEPSVPNDLKSALEANLKARETWMNITPMARWDWIRWINSTKNAETRRIRIEKTFSKFKSGIRRPCCFNRTECTVPDVSNKGVLLEPSKN